MSPDQRHADIANHLQALRAHFVQGVGRSVPVEVRRRLGIVEVDDVDGADSYLLQFGMVVDQGWAYLYFGGTQTVTDGTLTIIYSASGISTLTL